MFANYENYSQDTRCIFSKAFCYINYLQHSPECDAKLAKDSPILSEDTITWQVNNEYLWSNKWFL